MTLFSETRVELSMKVLDFFPEADSLESRCTELHQSLKELCPSVSFNVTTNDKTGTETESKLEICGQWEDIVKVKELLNDWSSYKDTHPKTSLTLKKFLSDPEAESDFVDENQHDQPKTPPRTRGRKKKQDDESVVSVEPTPSRKLSSRLKNSVAKREPILAPSEVKKEKDDDEQYLASSMASSRPRRSIQNTVLPLLKRKVRTATPHSGNQSPAKSQQSGSRKRKNEESVNKVATPTVEVEKSSTTKTPAKSRRGRPSTIPDGNTPHGTSQNEDDANFKVLVYSPLKVEVGRPRRKPSAAVDKVAESDCEIQNDLSKEAVDSPLKVPRGHGGLHRNVNAVPVEIKPEMTENSVDDDKNLEDVEGIENTSRDEGEADASIQNSEGDQDEQLAIDTMETSSPTEQSDEITDVQQTDNSEASEISGELAQDESTPVTRTKRQVYQKMNYDNALIDSMIIEKDDEYECKECSRRSRQLKYLKYHVVRVHMSKNFKCDDCDKSYSLPKDLAAHRLTHNRPFQCEQCPMKFAQAYQLKKHKSSRHIAEPKKRGPKPKVPVKGTLTAFRCQRCPFVTQTKRYLNTHVQRAHADKIHQCPECPKAFALKKDFNNHMNWHDESTKCECEICHKVLVNKHGLKLHTNVVHLGLPPPPMKKYQCELCGRVSRNITDHKTHMNKTHLNIRPYQCPECPMSFFSQSGLRAHSFIHSNNYGYECKECGKKFKQRQGLRVHSFMHKAQEDLPYRCSSCDKTFTQPGALYRHKRTHTGERPYICKYCNAAFSDYSVLRRHLMGAHKLKDNLVLVRSMIKEACKEAQKLMELKALSGEDLTVDEPREDIMHRQRAAANRQASRKRKVRMAVQNPTSTIIIKHQANGQWVHSLLPNSAMITPKEPQNLSIEHIEIMPDPNVDQSLNNFITQLQGGGEPEPKKQKLDTDVSAAALQLSPQHYPDHADVHNYSVQLKPDENTVVKLEGCVEPQDVEAMTMEPQYITETQDTEQYVEPTDLGQPETQTELQVEEGGEMMHTLPDVVQPQVIPAQDESLVGSIPDQIQPQNVQVNEAGDHMALAADYEGLAPDAGAEVQASNEEAPEDIKPEVHYNEEGEEETITLPEGLLQQLQSQHLTMLQDGRPVVLQTVNQGEDTEHIIVITQMADDQQPDLGTLLSVQPDGEIQPSYENVGDAVEVAYQEAVVGNDQGQLDGVEQGEVTVAYSQAPTMLEMLQQDQPQ